MNDISEAPDRLRVASDAPVAASRRLVRRRRSWRPWLGLILLIGLVAAAGVWWWYAQAQSPADAYVTAEIQRGDVENSITALGTLQPLEYVDVGTQISGQLRKLHVEVGDEVAQGDLLAEIDAAVYLARVEASRAQLLNLRAQLADRQAQLVLAQQQAERQRNLLRANATSQEAVQSSAAAERSAAAQVEAIKAQIQQTESTLKGDEANLGYTKILAPIAGTVVSQSAKQGQTLNANQQAPIILSIADLSNMTVSTQVSEADVSRLDIGMDAHFSTLGQPERRWSGKLRQILPTPEILNNVVFYHALFDVPNPDRELMTQMSAQVFFVIAAAHDVLLVPVAALQPVNGPAGSPGQFVVQVVSPNGDLQERRVAIGVSNRVMAEVKEGLAVGDRVVIWGGALPPARTQRTYSRPARLS